MSVQERHSAWCKVELSCRESKAGDAMIFTITYPISQLAIAIIMLEYHHIIDCRDCRV